MSKTLQDTLLAQEQRRIRNDQLIDCVSKRKEMLQLMLSLPATDSRRIQYVSDQMSEYLKEKDSSNGS